MCSGNVKVIDNVKYRRRHVQAHMPSTEPNTALPKVPFTTAVRATIEDILSAAKDCGLYSTVFKFLFDQLQGILTGVLTVQVSW